MIAARSETNRGSVLDRRYSSKITNGRSDTTTFAAFPGMTHLLDQVGVAQSKKSLVVDQFTIPALGNARKASDGVLRL